MQNDWIVAKLNNPEFNAQDMQDVLGMNLDNTQLLPKDTYMQSDFIKEHPAFKNEDGTFSEDKFNRFYESTLPEWGNFTENEKIDNFEYSLFDPRAKADSSYKDPHFRFETVINPDRVTTGISGWNQVGQRKYTPNELAQTQKIFDPETGTFLDETPNDSALTVKPLKFLKSLFDDPLMLATWDEDGEHYDQALGRTVEHKKGQYKLNDEGTYYTEKVAGRSTVGKQVVSALDLITVDGSPINKYDFFDSDGLDKSVTGTIAKSLVSVAPMFMGPVGEVYAGVLIARELAKSLPMLYGMATALFGNEEDSSVLNTIAAYGQKFSGGVSEYGQAHTFSFEQIGNMMADVAVQWGQQKLIAGAVNKLRGGTKALNHAEQLAKMEYDDQVAKLTSRIKQGLSNPMELRQYAMDLTGKGSWKNSLFGQTALQKYLPAAEAVMKRNARVGADAALAYMAIVSNYDVYNSMLEHGTTHKEAAIVALGSTLGMFSVDRFLGLGEMFFDDLEDEAKVAIRRYTKEEAGKWAESVAKANNVATKTIDETKGLMGRTLANAANRNAEIADATLLRKAMNFGKALGEEISAAKGNFAHGLATHTLNATGKAVGEGLEEMTEEFVTDISKQLYEWAGQLGVDTSVKDVGAWDNAFERYAMSFLGGAAGGGLFYGISRVQENKAERQNPEAKDAEREIVYLLRQGRKSEIMNELDKLHKKGKLGSTKLGISSEVDSKSGQKHFLTTQPGEQSQNDVIYDRLVEGINQIDSYIHNYGANLSEDDLFKQMVLGNERLMAIKDRLNGASYSSNYRQGFQDALEKVVSAEIALKGLNTEMADLEKARQKAENPLDILAQITEKQKIVDTETKALNEAKQVLSDYLTGKKSMYYARKTAWLADPIVSSPFTYHTFDQWLYKEKGGLTLDKLSPAEMQKFKDEYFVELQAKKGLNDDEMFDMFLRLEKDFTPLLTQLEQNQDQVVQLNEAFKELQKLNDDILKLRTSGLLTYEDRLPDETDEEYESRNSALEGETPEQTAQRGQARAAKINEYNNTVMSTQDHVVNSLQKITELIENTGAIDPRTRRQLKGILTNVNRRVAYRNALIQQLTTPVDAVTTTYSPLYQEKLFKLYKDVFTTALDQLDEAYSKRAKGAQQVNEVASKIQEALNSGNIEEVVKLGLRDVTTRNAVFGQNIDVTDVDESNEEQVSGIVEQLRSNPALLEDIRINIDDFVTRSQDTLQEFANAALNEEVASGTIEGIRDAIKGANNFMELVTVISSLNSDEDVFAIESSVKSNVATILEGMAKSIETATKSLIEAPNEEELSNAIKNSLSVISSDILKTITGLTYTTSGDENPVKLFSNNRKFKDAINQSVQEFGESLEPDLISAVKEDTYIKFFDTVDAKLTAVNPISEIAKVVADKYGIAEGDIDEVLDTIQARLDGLDNLDDFTLLPHQEQTLDYLNFVFDVVKAFLHQSATVPTWLSPFGHAKFWNDFAAKNADVVGQDFHLPELQGGLAEQFKTELSLYQQEMKDWKERHAANAVNKERQFNTAGQKLEDAKLTFYKHNIGAFRGLTLNDMHVDILDDIADDDDSRAIETKIANNIYELLNSGVSLKDLLTKAKTSSGKTLLESVLPEAEGLADLISQDTNLLDDKLDYANMTGYQKVQLLLSALLYNTSKFEQHNKENLGKNPELAPISIQKQIIQAGKGFINGAYAISQIYEALNEGLKDDSNFTSLPLLDRVMIIEGVGGAGKTKAVVRQIVEDVPDDAIWVAAPVKAQLNGLMSNIGKTATGFEKNQLMEQIVEDSKAYKASISSIKSGRGDANFEKVTRGGGVIYKDTGALKLKAPAKSPKVLVIDEATHFSNYDIQLINRWARENNVQVILLGDQHQMGSALGNSLAPGYLFTLFRTPKLTVSLRESNIHVQNNNAALDQVISSAEKFKDDLGMTGAADEEKLQNYVNNQLRGVTLSYYQSGEVFNGTAVVEELPNEIFELIKAKYNGVEESKRYGIVAFVGDASKSAVAKKLKDAGIVWQESGEQQNVFKTVGDIQSQEFDYVISDIPLKITPDEESNYFGEDALNLARKLYTLNTRAKEGIVIIKNDFDEAIGASVKRASVTAPAKTISDAVANFRAAESDRLSAIEFDGEYHDLSEITPPAPKTAEETPEVPPKPEVTPEKETAKQEQTAQTAEEVSHEMDEAEEKKTSIESSTESDLYSPTFSMTGVGYFMPILGGYTRTGETGQEHKYIKLPNSTVGSTTILEDLAAVAILDKTIPSEENSELTTEQLTNTVSKYENLIRNLFTHAIHNTHNLTGWHQFISTTELDKILAGTSDQKLADGRTAGIYLEAHDYGAGDRYVGLGTASDSAEDMTINGKVYKYVLRFTPTSLDLGNKGYEVAITLSMAANPETWKKKLKRLERAKSKVTNPDEQVALQKEIDALTKDIENYTKYLEEVAKRDGGVKVSFKSAFTKVRSLGKQVRLKTLDIEVNRRGRKVDSGWEQQMGKYKSMSDLFVLGSDLDELGVKASNSGKVAMFVSEFAYNPTELKRIYMQEKQMLQETHDSPCTVRLLIMSNAGINWSSLTAPKYKDLYSSSISRSGTSEYSFNFPFKSEAMGYRFLVAMWNWRADLTRFLEAYKEVFNDEDDKVLQIIGAVDEIYKANGDVMPDDVSGFQSILDSFGVTADDVQRLRTFNDETCKNIHTFRLGGYKHGKRVQRLNVDAKEYFGQTKMPEYVKDSGVIGLYITPQLARTYLAFTQGIFDIFTDSGADLKLSEITFEHDGNLASYNVRDRINAERLGSLASSKTPEDQRTKGNSFTNFLDNLMPNVRTIQVNDGEGNTYNISFDNVGNGRQLSKFMGLVTHLYALMRNAAYLANAGETVHPGSLSMTLDSEGKSVVKLSYAALQQLVTESVGKYTTKEGNIKNQLVQEDDPEFRFEFGDMFDLMLHGTLSDVSTHALEFDKDTHRVTGGRDDHLKISDAVFKRGMFIDPRVGAREESSTDDNALLYKTSVDHRLILTDTTTELGVDFELPTLGTPAPKIETSYKLSDDLSLQLDAPISSIDRTTVLGNSTFEQIVADAGGTFNADGTIALNGKTYEATLLNGGQTINLVEKAPVSKLNTKLGSITHPDVADLIGEPLEYTTLIDDTRLGDFIINSMADERFTDPMNLTFSNVNGDIIVSYIDFGPVGKVLISGNTLTFTALSNVVENPEVEPEPKQTPEANPELAEKFQDILSSEDGEVEENVLNFFKTNADKLSIVGDYLTELEELTKNKNFDVLYDEDHWTTQLYQQMKSCNI